MRGGEMTREDINDIINAICPNDEDYEKPCISPKYLRQELEQLALDQRQWNEDSTTKNDLEVREFEEIVVEYPPEDLCTYPEYKGKPYFSIKYKEGNDYFIGYGTYNPKVFSKYLRDYFMPSVTPIRPKGHWYIDERPESNREVICSNCEQPIFRYHELYFDYRPKYCPNCGVEMSEVEK